MFCFTDTPVYYPLNMTVGQSVNLVCNISLSADIMWTYETHDPYIVYVYWKGHLDSDKPRLSVNTAGGDFHSLVISDVQLNDSGLYNCYDDKGLRQVAYELIVNGMYWLLYTISNSVLAGSVKRTTSHNQSAAYSQNCVKDLSQLLFSAEIGEI